MLTRGGKDVYPTRLHRRARLLRVAASLVERALVAKRTGAAAEAEGLVVPGEEGPLFERDGDCLGVALRRLEEDRVNVLVEHRARLGRRGRMRRADKALPVAAAAETALPPHPVPRADVLRRDERRPLGPKRERRLDECTRLRQRRPPGVLLDTVRFAIGPSSAPLRPIIAHGARIAQGPDIPGLRPVLLGYASVRVRPPALPASFMHRHGGASPPPGCHWRLARQCACRKRDPLASLRGKVCHWRLARQCSLQVLYQHWLGATGGCPPVPLQVLYAALAGEPPVAQARVHGAKPRQKTGGGGIKRLEGGVVSYLVIEQPKPGQIPCSDPALLRNRGARIMRTDVSSPYYEQVRKMFPGF